MRLLDPKISKWARRHIYLFIALAAVIVFVGGYFGATYLTQLARETFSTLSEDDPNWLFYRDGGYGLVLFFLSFLIGVGLLIVALFVAIWQTWPS